MRTYMYVIRYARTAQRQIEREREREQAGTQRGRCGRGAWAAGLHVLESGRRARACSVRHKPSQSALRWSFLFQGKRLRALGFSQTTTTVKKSTQQIHAPLRQEQGFLLICSGGTAEKEDEAAVGDLADLKQRAKSLAISVARTAAALARRGMEKAGLSRSTRIWMRLRA